MTITVNGVKRVAPDGLSIRGLLDELKLSMAATVVEVNGVICDRDTYDVHVIQPNDILELVQFVGGG